MKRSGWMIFIGLWDLAIGVALLAGAKTATQATFFMGLILLGVTFLAIELRK